MHEPLYLVSKRDFYINVCQKMAVSQWFELEGTIKDYLVQNPCCVQGHLSLAQAAQSPTLNIL